ASEPSACLSTGGLSLPSSLRASFDQGVRGFENPIGASSSLPSVCVRLPLVGRLPLAGWVCLLCAGSAVAAGEIPLAVLPAQQQGSARIGHHLQPGPVDDPLRIPPPGFDGPGTGVVGDRLGLS